MFLGFIHKKIPEGIWHLQGSFIDVLVIYLLFSNCYQVLSSRCICLKFKNSCLINLIHVLFNG